MSFRANANPLKRRPHCQGTPHVITEQKTFHNTHPWTWERRLCIQIDILRPTILKYL
jgi:hypothetical protein